MTDIMISVVVMLETERQFFDEHIEQFRSQYAGKFVVIKLQEFVGAFDTIDEALAEGAGRFGLDSFLVRHIGDVPREVSVPALTLGLLRAHPTHTIRG